MPTKPLQMLRKVPEVTVYFWVIKLLTTALGESTSDYLVGHYNPYAVVAVGFIGFVLILALQFKLRQYVPAVYWLAIVMVAVFGTMAADVIHVALGVPYIVSTVAFAVALVVVFALWKKVEGTLSIHSIYTSRRELFYWATVSTTFALGTAAGDLTAYTANLGFFSAGIAFAVMFAVPGIAYRLFRLNAVLSFWLAYILTRPLGASFADWAGKSKGVGGLGWGDGPVVALLGILIIALVAYLSITKADVDHGKAS